MVLYYKYYDVLIQFTIWINNDNYFDHDFLKACSKEYILKNEHYVTCLITDNTNTSEKSDNPFDIIFLCIDSPSKEITDNIESLNDYYDNILKDIPFSHTILEGNGCINSHNIIPEIFHVIKVPYPICSIVYNNKTITLREYTDTDFFDVYNLFNPLSITDGSSVRFMKEDKTMEYDNFCNQLLSYAFDNTGYYGLFEDNILIGQLAIIHHRFEDNLEYELSYFISSKYRHNNLTSYFADKLIDFFYMFHDLGDTIYSTIEHYNINSINFITKRGFNFLKDKESCLIYTNEPEDSKMQ